MSTSTRSLIDQASSRKRELCLYQAEGSGFELTYDGHLFRSSADESASVLAIDTICNQIGDRRNQIDLLIGGLGFGASLVRSLNERNLRSVVVVETDHRLLDWARRHLDLSGELADARTNVIEGVFESFVRASPQSYHGILIDVDRGPAHVILDSSRRTYSLTMLDLLARRLRTDGVAAVCLDEEDKAYRRAMVEVFSEVWSRPIAEDEAAGRAIYYGRA